MSEDRPYQDEAWLREKYLDDGLKQAEIGDECDVSQVTIGRWVEKFGFGTGQASGYERRDDRAIYDTHNEIYPVWRDRVDETRVFVHSLLAIAEGEDPEMVFSTDYHVHHPLNPPGVTLNTGWNVELLTHEEHSRVHNTPDEPYADGDWLREKYVEEGLSGPEIADLCDVHFGTIYRWMDHHGIERRDQPDAHTTSRSMSS